MSSNYICGLAQRTFSVFGSKERSCCLAEGHLDRSKLWLLVYKNAFVSPHIWTQKRISQATTEEYNQKLSRNTVSTASLTHFYFSFQIKDSLLYSREKCGCVKVYLLFYSWSWILFFLVTLYDFNTSKHKINAILQNSVTTQLVKKQKKTLQAQLTAQLSVSKDLYCLLFATALFF